VDACRVGIRTGCRGANEFYDKVRARGGTPASERRLREQIRGLKELRAADAKKLAQFKADIEALGGAHTMPRGRTFTFASSSPTATP
jgi:hypothetical protein